MLALSRYLSELEKAQPRCEVGMPGAMLLLSVSIYFLLLPGWSLFILWMF